jgi:hypothetical protein
MSATRHSFLSRTTRYAVSTCALDDHITGNATADLPNLNLLRPEIGSTEVLKQFTNLLTSIFSAGRTGMTGTSSRNDTSVRRNSSDHNPLQKLKAKQLKRESVTNT